MSKEKLILYIRCTCVEEKAEIQKLHAHWLAAKKVERAESAVSALGQMPEAPKVPTGPVAMPDFGLGAVTAVDPADAKIVTVRMPGGF